VRAIKSHSSGRIALAGSAAFAYRLRMHHSLVASLNHCLVAVALCRLKTPGASVLKAALLALVLAAAGWPSSLLAAPGDEQMRMQFKQAWQAAGAGRRSEFEQARAGLERYSLFPYWQYEDYRHRRASVPAAEMAAFLEQHQGWPFAGSLERAWLRSLGAAARWPDVQRYGAGQKDATLACYHARARLAGGDTAGLLAEAQALWAVGHSQPDACDPLFSWLASEDGISRDLAWQRIRLAVAAGNPRLTLYLSRFIPVSERSWLEEWQKLSRERYRNLAQAAAWPDRELPRMISAQALRKLAHYDSAEAIRLFGLLDPHFSWDADTRATVMREIGLMAAVDLEPAGLAFIQAMPLAAQDQQLREWRVRLALALGDWVEVRAALALLSPESLSDDRWRYWQARALARTGEPEQAGALFDELSRAANYYGFLAADASQQPYTICPEQPAVTPEQVSALAATPGFARALELRELGIDNWALAEWNMATRGLSNEQLQQAAALAQQQQWHDRAIFALGNSGDLRWYEWRFPLLWEQPIQQAASRYQLDPAWLLGVMRSESAMVETARSSAGAMGLMQVTPGTAQQISKQHGLPYKSSSQLMDGAFNIGFGSVYIRQLMDEFGQNPVLVSGAYNAGPNAVNRWLKGRPTDDISIWVETLPYYETRDYIPRVLAFTTIYNWRLQKPVQRLSSRMPGISSGTMVPVQTTQVVCQAPQPELTALSHSSR
jgi:soluble lytic murein transglycosylase